MKPPAYRLLDPPVEPDPPVELEPPVEELPLSPLDPPELPLIPPLEPPLDEPPIPPEFPLDEPGSPDVPPRLPPVLPEVPLPLEPPVLPWLPGVALYPCWSFWSAIVVPSTMCELSGRKKSNRCATQIFILARSLFLRGKAKPISVQ